MNDILLDENFDLRIENGDFVIGEATGQHQQLLLLIEKGENREFPLTGVGIQSLVNDEINEFWINAAVKKEFENDGMTVYGIVVENGQVYRANARYEND